MGTSEPPRFGALLRRHRERAGLMQEELAERAGLSARGISDLERGLRSHPRRDTVQRLADALGLAQVELAAFTAAARAAMIADHTPHEGAAATAAAAARHNLPRQFTGFVGREGAIAAVADLLATATLVTLTGSGGVGKTRLALAVAALSLPAYPDGVWLVDLAPLADPARIPQAVALALGVREEPGEALPATLARALRPRRLLLVLDNCEHLVDACAHVAQGLLQHCPHLRILATSREPLRVPGEVHYRVPSLALPEPAPAPAAAAIARSEAVQLFLARAREARPGFALTDANAPLVAQVCARLDGIPLALELAAARLRALPLEQIAQRLDDRFMLLTGGSRTALPRQQTLRATLDWSYRLLADGERALFRRLSVFAGGWTLEAAGAVCAGAGMPEAAVLEPLTRLVEQSLVQGEGEGGDTARYRLLETVRQYGAARLAEAGEMATYQARHAAWALAFAEARVAPGQGWQPAALAALDAERENLHQALAWLRARDPASWLRLTAALADYWQTRGLQALARPWLTEALARGGPPTLARARIAASLAVLSRHAGDPAAAREGFATALEAARAVGDRHQEVNALGYLGLLAGERGERAAALAHVGAALARARASGDRRVRGLALFYRSLALAHLGDHARAVLPARGAVAAFRAEGETWVLAASLTQLGGALSALGAGGASDALAEALALYARHGEQSALLLALAERGLLAQRLGDHTGALDWLARATDFAATIGRRDWDARLALVAGRAWWARGARDRAAECWWRGLARALALDQALVVAGGLEDVARLLAADDPAGAARLLGAASGLRAARGLGRAPVERPAHEALVAALRAGLGAAFASAWSAGEALTPEAAVATVRRADPVARHAPTGGASAMDMAALMSPPGAPPGATEPAKGEMGQRGASPGPVTPPRGPLVGRERELALLRARLAAALAGRGGVVLIAGEAGIGKTALAEALLAEAAGQGALSFVGGCYDLAETPPYGPWLDLLARYPPARDLPPLPDAFAPHDALGTVTSQDELQRQVRDFFHALAAAGPLVLLLEDLHWADPASLDLLRSLGRQLADQRLLLLATYRTDDMARGHPLAANLPLLARESEAAHLALAPLTGADLRGLLRSRYALPPADEVRLGDYLFARTEGNALFALELLRALEDGGVLRQGDGWALGALEHVAVPPLLAQVLAGRAARLGEDAARLLRVAAVIGQEVPLDLWAAVADADEEALLAAAEAAEEARILGEAQRGDGVRFTHALVREALYDGLAPVRRRRVHRRVADALAAAPAPDPDAVAHHLQRAGDPRAADWLIRAGERAEAAYAWPTAVERFAAAERLLAEEADRRRERAWLLFDLARLLRYADAGRALGCCEEAGRLAAALRDDLLAAHIHWLHGWIVGNAGDFARATALREQAVAIVDALPAGERGRDLLVRGTVAQSAAHWREQLAAWYTSVGRFRDALALGEPLLADPAAGVELYAGLSGAYAALGLPEAARALSGQRLALERARGHFPMIGFALVIESTRVQLPYFADDVTGRRQMAAEAVDAWRRASEALGVLDPQIAAFPMLALEGRWAEAERLWPATQGLPEGGFTRQIYTNNLLTPWVALRIARGQGGEAWPVLRAALPEGLATPPGATSYAATVAVQRGAAAVALAGGDLDTARRWLAAHDRWLAWSGAVRGRAEGRTLRAQYHRQAGNLARARAHADQALAAAGSPHQPLALLAAHRLLGELDTEVADFAAATAHLGAALALADACAAPYERALTLLALADVHAAMGSRGPALVALGEAESICAPLEARPALARAAAIRERLVAIR